MRAVAARVGLRPPRIYGLMAKGMFPKPVKIHGRSVAWFSHEVDQWLATRPRAGEGSAA
jgi:prophage regulatory protein